MKIFLKVIDGSTLHYSAMYGEYSDSLDNAGLQSVYNANKKKFIVGYTFTLKKVTFEVTKIEEKQNQKSIIFYDSS